MRISTLKFIIILTLLFITKNTFCQVIPIQYFETINIADSLYHENEYRKSALHYSAAFKLLGWKGFSKDRYHAACSWALIGKKDSAFFHLNIIAFNQNYSNYQTIFNDRDFRSLYTDPRWQVILDQVLKNHLKKDALLNRELTAVLDTVYFDDRKYRMQIDAIENAFGIDSDEMKNLWEIINRKDAINLHKVSSILSEYGWLGSEIVGENGNNALFNVIHHADVDVQAKHLSLIREAARNGKVSSVQFAYMEDRIALRQGRKQIYGTQMGRDTETNLYYVMPFIEPDHIDQRRAEFRLTPLADQLKSYNIQWDLEQYKKDLPMLEEKLKNSSK